MLASGSPMTQKTVRLTGLLTGQALGGATILEFAKRLCLLGLFEISHPACDSRHITQHEDCEGHDPRVDVLLRFLESKNVPRDS